MGERPELRVHRGSERGADEGEGVRREVCKDGCPPPHRGRVPESAGEFWCKLGAFCIVQVNHLKLKLV